jgi:signal peptidase I
MRHGHVIGVPNGSGVTMRIRTIASVCTQLLVLGLIGAAFCLRAPHVSGLSMEPRIHSGEFVLINTLAYRMGGSIGRGDIVAFRHESPTPRTYLKRVIGLPGDRVSIERGAVSIDGKPLDERYVRYRDGQSRATVVVPAGGVYVLGDNRANSDDSRNWGILPIDDVLGKAIVTLWPPQELGAP